MDSLLLNTTPSPDSAAGNHQTPNPLPKLPGLPTDFGARRPSRAAPRPPEHLPCPRCDSPNTKFCYYNNYNLSQPRHFCKSCRRYWTHGGALRNVPVGGGTRKSASAANKRSRRTVPAASKSDGTQVIPFVGDTGAAGRAQTLDPDPEPGSVSASCFWSNEEMGSGGGGFPFNGYPGIGLGLGPGYEQTGLDWPIVMEQVGVGDGGPLVAAGESAGCDTWRIGGGGADGSAVEGDYFLWPDLAISTPAANPSSE